MITKTKIATIFISLLLCLSLNFPCNTYAEASKIIASVATGPVGTASYQIGVGVGDILNKKGFNVALNVEESKGWLENVRLLSNGEVEFGHSTGRFAYDAYMAKGMYKNLKPKQLFSIIAQSASVAEIYVTKKSGIKSVYEFKGKKIAIGQPGGASGLNSKTLFEAAGLDLKDMKVYEIRLQDAVNMVKDGQIDGGIWYGMVPLSALVELFLVRDVNMLPVPAEVVMKMCELNPAYIPDYVPPGYYKGVDLPVPSVQDMGIWLANRDVSEEAVYQVTKAIVENLGDLGNVHASFKRMHKGMFLTGLSIPLHPGALKYYKEINLPGLDAFLKQTEPLR